MLVEVEQKSKRRGRPRGKAKVNREVGIRLHDLAFARAVVQGVCPSSAAERYLPELPVDQRVAAGHFRRLMNTGADMLIGMGDLAAANVLKEWAEPHEVAAATSSSATPSLEEFAQEMGAEDFSERELLEMYRDRYGEHGHAEQPPPARSTSAKVLQALSAIQSRGVVLPKPTDVLRQWFSTSLVGHLAGVGLECIDDLVAYTHQWGPHWYRRVTGVGRSRGARVSQWLKDHASFLGGALDADETLVKVELGVDLVGTSAGLLRSDGPNAMGARSDQDALKSWLSTLDIVSPHTKRAYARDVGRLLVWARVELGKGLSELTVGDAVQHARFLQAPSQKWIAAPGCRHALPISMRAALAPSSASRALAAIGHFYGFLVETQYLRANPFARVRAPKDKGVQMDVQRCFSNAHLQAMQLTLVQMPACPRKRRLVAILALLEGTGLRIGEIPASWCSVVEVRDPTAGKVTCLKVLGKGGRERLLPLKPEVIEALKAHREDQVAVAGDTQGALIGLIDEPVHRHPPGAGGSLSTARLRMVLKDFFRQVAAQTPADMADDFHRASPHFLRHTFAHRVLSATNQDLAVTQQLLGHKSISTTGIYVKAGLAQRLEALTSLRLETLHVPG